ncbi:MAG: redox-regulated ATPase YchF [Planctomycetia bacterium]|nr:redox-regulated ATPase YchF [Planctomycetia bacterium]
MRIGLVGYQASGKSSIFELLTGMKPDPAKAHSGQIGMAVLPDPRFDGLVKLFNPKKVTPAKIELFDTPGLDRVHGDSNNQRISVVREANALVHVIGAYAGGDPVADARNFEDDLMLADLQVLENRIERLEASVKKNRPDREACQEELALIRPVQEMLQSGKLLRNAEFTAEQEQATKSFSLLTRKPQLLLLNTADAADESATSALSSAGYKVVAAPLGLELEVQALDESERAAFAADFGLKEPSRERVLRAIFEATEQITFFTSDEKEVRAWLLRRGMTAFDAAGTIHTDLARGFIRAEIMAVDDLLRLGSEREVKAANLYHTVGKDHVMRDGDEIVVRFSV